MSLGERGVRFSIAELDIIVEPNERVEVPQHNTVYFDGTVDTTQVCESRFGRAVRYPTLEESAVSGGVECKVCSKLWL